MPLYLFVYCGYLPCSLLFFVTFLNIVVRKLFNKVDKLHSALLYE